MTAYILTTDVEADLRGIIRYTRKQWGTAQVRRYIARLEHGIADLAAGRGSFRDMSELFPELRMIHCEHHYVFVCHTGVRLHWLSRFFMNAWISWPG